MTHIKENKIQNENWEILLVCDLIFEIYFSDLKLEKKQKTKKKTNNRQKNTEIKQNFKKNKHYQDNAYWQSRREFPKSLLYMRTHEDNFWINLDNKLRTLC
jgi:hypothetical protein